MMMRKTAGSLAKQTVSEGRIRHSFGRISLFNRGYSTDAENATTEPKDVDPQTTSPPPPDDRDKRLKELQDAYLTSLADMENLRARTKREVEAASQFAIQKFCRDIIGTADVLEMALRAADPQHPILRGDRNEESSSPSPSSPSSSSSSSTTVPNIKVDEGSSQPYAQRLQDLIDGLVMTLAELRRSLSRHGVTIVDPMHQKFDPNLHMAIYQVPTTAVEPGTVVDVQKKGYLLHQRVLRAAEVGVSRMP